MTLLIQRVFHALVTTNDQSAEIEKGLLVYVSFHPKDVAYDLLNLA
jgi:D-Tyr-tRNAtyr deacylase